MRVFPNNTFTLTIHFCVELKLEAITLALAVKLYPVTGFNFDSLHSSRIASYLSMNDAIGSNVIVLKILDIVTICPIIPTATILEHKQTQCFWYI